MKKAQRRRDHKQMFCSLEILDILTEAPMGTVAVAKKLGCHPRTAWRRLRKLRDEGKIGGNKLHPYQAGEWVWYRKKEEIVPIRFHQGV